MKKNLLFLFLLPSVFCFSQKLAVNNIDTTLNIVEKHTSWEKFSRAGSFNSFFRISQWDKDYFFELRIIMDPPRDFAIASGEELVLTMPDGKNVSLKCFKTAMTCMGCGANAIVGSQVPGMQVSYSLPIAQMDILKINPILTKEEYERHKKMIVEKLTIKVSGISTENKLSENSYHQIRKAIRLVKK